MTDQTTHEKIESLDDETLVTIAERVLCFLVFTFRAQVGVPEAAIIANGCEYIVVNLRAEGDLATVAMPLRADVSEALAKARNGGKD